MGMTKVPVVDNLNWLPVLRAVARILFPSWEQARKFFWPSMGACFPDKFLKQRVHNWPKTHFLGYHLLITS